MGSVCVKGESGEVVLRRICVGEGGGGIRTTLLVFVCARIIWAGEAPLDRQAEQKVFFRTQTFQWRRSGLLSLSLCVCVVRLELEVNIL